MRFAADKWMANNLVHVSSSQQIEIIPTRVRFLRFSAHSLSRAQTRTDTYKCTHSEQCLAGIECQCLCKQTEKPLAFLILVKTLLSSSNNRLICSMNLISLLVLWVYHIHDHIPFCLTDIGAINHTFPRWHNRIDTNHVIEIWYLHFIIFLSPMPPHDAIIIFQFFPFARGKWQWSARAPDIEGRCIVSVVSLNSRLRIQFHLFIFIVVSQSSAHIQLYPRHYFFKTAILSFAGENVPRIILHAYNGITCLLLFDIISGLDNWGIIDQKLGENIWLNFQIEAWGLKRKSIRPKVYFNGALFGFACICKCAVVSNISLFIIWSIYLLLFIWETRIWRCWQ